MTSSALIFIFSQKSAHGLNDCCFGGIGFGVLGTGMCILAEPISEARLLKRAGMFSLAEPMRGAFIKKELVVYIL